MSRVFNKMYIVSGRVSPEDRLSSYRFQTRRLLDKVPDWQWTHRLNDDAIEVDTNGKRVKYDTCRGDNYWNTWDDTKLKDLKCRRVACINDRWTAIDIDPFTDDTDDYLEKKGYRRKLGEHGSGWYDGEHMPKFETAVFTYIYRDMQLVWDDRGNRHAGIVPHMKDRELRIYSGKSRGSYDKQIGENPCRRYRRRCTSRRQDIPVLPGWRPGLHRLRQAVCRLPVCTHAFGVEPGWQGMQRDDGTDEGYRYPENNRGVRQAVT